MHPPAMDEPGTKDASMTLRPLPGPRSPLAMALLFVAGLVLGSIGLSPAHDAQAQSLFSPEVYVNDSAITRYEVDQRVRFFEALGSGGADPRARARDRLIDERVQVQEAMRLGVRASGEQVQAALAEFAARAELSGDEFLARMAEAGVDRDTVLSFLRAGVLWRELVNARFGPEILVTGSQIERAQTPESVIPVTEILISEIFLPSDPQFAEAVNQLIPQILALPSLETFADAARQVSAAPSAPQGGRVERWLQMGVLPEPIAEQFRDAPVGTIAGPLEVPGAFGIFQLRARRETRDVPANLIEVDFRRADLPGGRSEANLAIVERLRARADSCVDFEAEIAAQIQGIPSESMAVQSVRQNALGSGLATELARLNPREISAGLVENGALVVLMLCNRRVQRDPEAPPAQIRLDLFNQTLEGQALVYLRTLRAEADIRTR